MTLQQLRYVLAIVDHGLNITAAARRLETSQPGVSKQLRVLEKELGFQLFSRRGKSLTKITAEGEEIVEKARSIMEEVEGIRLVSARRRAQVIAEHERDRAPVEQPLYEKSSSGNGEQYLAWVEP